MRGQMAKVVGEIGFIWTSCGARIHVDAEDLTRCLRYSWSLVDKERGYAKAKTDKGMVKLHRFILGLSPTDPDVDHINGDTLDNRKSNLRLATASLNAMNRRKKTNSNNRFIGVYRHPNGWVARININKRKVYLGLFASEVEAARVRDAKAVEVYGGDVTLNLT